jgi:hypothetical protein
VREDPYDKEFDHGTGDRSAEKDHDSRTKDSGADGPSEHAFISSAAERSQRATGQAAEQSLLDRSSGKSTKDAALEETLERYEREKGFRQKKASDENLVEFEFGAVDLVDTSDVGHLSYNKFHVAYHSDTGEIVVTTPEGFIDTLEQLKERKEKTGTIRDLKEKLEFVLEEHKFSDHIKNFAATAYEKLMEAVDTSEKADPSEESSRAQEAMDGNSYSRGLVDWPSFRAERLVSTDSGNAKCNMPDFKSPGIEKSFK